MINYNFLRQINIFIKKAMIYIVSNEHRGFYILSIKANITFCWFLLNFDQRSKSFF